MVLRQAYNADLRRKVQEQEVQSLCCYLFRGRMTYERNCDMRVWSAIDVGQSQEVFYVYGS